MSLTHTCHLYWIILLLSSSLPFSAQVGCGADELIDLLMRCVLDPGDCIVDTPPTFTMYAFDAAVNDAQVVTVPRRADFSIDVQGAPGVSHLLLYTPMHARLLYRVTHAPALNTQA